MLLIGTVGAILADPNLPNIAPHRHFIRHADGTLTEVGPNVCDNPRLQNAFNQFHSNVHQLPPSGQLGPVAPGLHNGIQADLVARGCSFVP
jgi:hypothetical protein